MTTNDRRRITEFSGHFAPILWAVDVSSCGHLVSVSLVSGHSVKTEFKLLRSTCRLKETDPVLRGQMNEAQRDRLEPSASADQCPYAASGDYTACRWHQG